MKRLLWAAFRFFYRLVPDRRSAFVPLSLLSHPETGVSRKTSHSASEAEIILDCITIWEYSYNQKMRYLLCYFFLFISFPVIAHCGPGEKGHHGQGQGGHRGMPEESRSVIHDLFAQHKKVTRAVKLTPQGYTAETTSSDPAVVSQLQKHVKQMKARLNSGLGVRQWDPAFREFREHYDDLKIQIQNIQNGVAVNVTGSTPEAIAAARNHASVISQFVKNGSSEMHATHPASR